MKRLLPVAAIAAALSGGAAAQAVDPSDLAAVRGAIAVTTDSYQGTTRVKGPEICTSRKWPAGCMAALEMNFIDAPDGDELALYVSMITDSRTGDDYRSAASGGHDLRVQTEAKKVRGCSGGGRYLSGGCSYLEALWIIFDRADLSEAARNGFSFAVYGEGPRKEFYLPAAYFAAFKEQVDKISPEPSPIP